MKQKRNEMQQLEFHIHNKLLFYVFIISKLKMS